MSKNFLKSILSPIGKGLIIFATFGFALYAYGAVSFPNDAPDDASGVLGIYVDSAPTSKGSMIGYSGANSDCAGETTGSHVCSISEVVNSYNHSVSELPIAGIMWVTSGPTFSGSNIANDCEGWTTEDGSDLGAIWFFGADNGSSGITPCSLSYQLACCK